MSTDTFETLRDAPARCAPIAEVFALQAAPEAELRRICLGCARLPLCEVDVLTHDVAGYAAAMTAPERRTIRRRLGIPGNAAMPISLVDQARRMRRAGRKPSEIARETGVVLA